MLDTTLRDEQSNGAAPVNPVKSVFDHAPKLRRRATFAESMGAGGDGVAGGGDDSESGSQRGGSGGGVDKGGARARALSAAGSVGTAGSASSAGSERFWLSNVFKLLITHLQLLGLLRGIRMGWPGGMDKVRRRASG
jgi:hypothetical protein